MSYQKLIESAKILTKELENIALESPYLADDLDYGIFEKIGKDVDLDEVVLVLQFLCQSLEKNIE